jgi:hypothetical protein
MSCKIPVYNICVKRNRTFKGLRFQILQEDGVTPVNLTGYTFLMQAKENDRSPVIRDFAPYSDDPVNGWVVIDSFEVTAPVKNYHYDFVLVDADGNKTTRLTGIYQVDESYSN